jgi:hypothetical protein
LREVRQAHLQRIHVPRSDLHGDIVEGLAFSGLPWPAHALRAPRAGSGLRAGRGRTGERTDVRHERCRRHAGGSILPRTSGFIPVVPARAGMTDKIGFPGSMRNRHSEKHRCVSTYFPERKSTAEPRIHGPHSRFARIMRNSARLFRKYDKTYLTRLRRMKSLRYRKLNGRPFCKMRSSR